MIPRPIGLADLASDLAIPVPAPIGSIMDRVLFVFLGSLMIVVSAILATNYRGVTDWYVRRGYRAINKEQWVTDRMVRRQCVYYGAVLVLGVLLLLAGLAQVA